MTRRGVRGIWLETHDSTKLSCICWFCNPIVNGKIGSIALVRAKGRSRNAYTQLQSKFDYWWHQQIQLYKGRVVVVKCVGLASGCVGFNNNEAQLNSSQNLWWALMEFDCIGWVPTQPLGWLGGQWPNGQPEWKASAQLISCSNGQWEVRAKTLKTIPWALNQMFDQCRKPSRLLIYPFWGGSRPSNGQSVCSRWAYYICAPCSTSSSVAFWWESTKRTNTVRNWDEYISCTGIFLQF